MIFVKIDVNKLKCSFCSEIFYELDGYELLECPHCQEDFNSDDEVDLVSRQIAEIEIDHKTGELRFAPGV